MKAEEDRLARNSGGLVGGQVVGNRRGLPILAVTAVVVVAALAWRAINGSGGRGPDAAGRFPVERLANAETVTLTDITGAQRVLAREKAERLYGILAEAVYEADELPERETGGGIAGELRFTSRRGEPLTVYVHHDFLRFEHRTYFLAAEKIRALLELFR